MRIKEGFILRRIANSNMVIPVGDNIVDFNGVITLNEAAAFLWKLLREGSDLSLLSAGLVEEYNIPVEQAQTDAFAFVRQLARANILEEC